MVQVYLPLINVVCGGVVFSFAIGIAMGVSCNLFRLSVIVFSHANQFRFRICIGAVCSFLFTMGYFALVWANINESVSFWLGLVMALFGGVGNAQIMSTGYGLASMCERPLGSTLFFFGQAVAAIICWPLKLGFKQISDSPVVQLALGMGVPALFMVCTLIGVRKKKEEILEKSTPPHNSLKDIKLVFTAAVVPLSCLWVIYFSTGLITPGQVIHWPPPIGETASASYKSICTYTLLVSEALGKAVPVVVSLVGNRMAQFVSSKYSQWLVVAFLLIRVALVPVFYFPPNSDQYRFPILALFGFLSGVAASVALSLAAAAIPDGRKDLVGYLASFAIINGLFIGAIGSLVINQVRN